MPKIPVVLLILIVSAPVRTSRGQVTISSPYVVERVTTDDGLPAHQIGSVFQEDTGYLWIRMGPFTVRYDGYRMVDAERRDDPAITGPTMRGDTVRVDGLGPMVLDDFRVTKSGAAWGVAAPAAEAGAGTCRAGGDWYVVRVDGSGAAPVARSPVSHVIFDRSNDDVVMVEREGGFVTVSGSGGDSRGRYFVPPSACPLLLDRDGVLWVADAGFLLPFTPESPEPLARLDIGIRDLIGRRVFEDREGLIWIQTTTQGLLKVRRVPFQVISATADPALAVTQVGMGPSGRIRLFGSAVPTLEVELDRGRPVVSRLNERWSSGRLHDPRGLRIQLTGDPERQRPGMVHIDRWNGSRFEPAFDFRTGSERGGQLYADPTDTSRAWFFDAKAVYRIDRPMQANGELTKVVSGELHVRSLLVDRSGTLWVAGERGLTRVDAGGETRFGTADGLPVAHTRVVYEDDGGTIWVGTYGGGIARFENGRFRAVSKRDGLAEDIVSSILEDDFSNFWMAGNQGVHRVARADLEAFLDGRLARVPSTRYDRRSGLVNPETTGFPAVKTEDGRMWFPTYFGVAMVNPPDALRLERTPPLVHIESVESADSTFDVAGGHVVLPPADRRFTVTYTGIGMRHPGAITFRYRLEGVDPDWIDGGVEHRAAYTNVKPGTYTFRVQALGFGGVRSERDAVLTLTVEPRFHETPWFLLCCLLVVAAALYSGYRWRVRSLVAHETELNVLVGKRTEELRREKEIVAAQAEALAALDEAKSRVFANISHEFRTPLTLILGPLEDVQDGQHGPVTDAIARQVRSAIVNGRRLLRLVNQLLDVSRLESGRIELEAREVDLGFFVERFAQAFVPYADSKRLQFRYEAPERPIRAWIDPEQFEKVLTNLLGNAFKFTPEEGSIVVRLARDGEEMAILTVEDDGPGIAAEHLPFVFERFYQADASSVRRQPGTGIGLALVKHLVGLHHGTIAVESEPGRRTVFSVRIPLGKAHLREEETVDGSFESPWEEPATALADEIRFESRETPAPAREEEAAARATVLVADDNADIRSYVRAHLGSRFRVVEAADGREALERIRSELPDLVVSDVMMPELDGFGLCRAIREDPETDFVPVILLTARASGDSRIEGLLTGADDYLTKPFDVRELEVRVENLIASRGRLKARFAAPAVPPGADGSGVPGVGPHGTDEVILRALSVIDARLAEDDFDVDELASSVGVGRTSLYRRFADHLGTSPMDVVWSRRLVRAADLLAAGQGTVSEVAYGVGFKSVAHFCNRFKDAYGCTPAMYARGGRDAS